MTDQPLNTRVLLASRPTGRPGPESFRIEAAPRPEPADGELLLRTIYLSLDPYMRGRMSDAKSYAAPVELGAVMEGGTVSEVVESRSDDFAPGDVVLSHVGWQEWGVQPARHVRRRNQNVKRDQHAQSAGFGDRVSFHTKHARVALARDPHESPLPRQPALSPPADKAHRLPICMICCCFLSKRPACAAPRRLLRRRQRAARLPWR